MLLIAIYNILKRMSLTTPNCILVRTIRHHSVLFSVDETIFILQRQGYLITETGTRVTVNYTVASTSQDDDGETVSVNVPKAYKVYIGSAVPSEDGDQEISGYYYSPDGSTVVYSADAETIDAILGYLSYEPAADTAED